MKKTLVLSLLLFFTSLTRCTAQELLFEFVKSPIIDKKQRETTNQFRSEKWNSKVSFVEIDHKTLEDEQITLNVEPDNSDTWVTFNRRSIESEGEFLTVTGKREKPIRNVTLVCRDELVIGQIVLEDTIYAVRPLGGKLHALIERDVDGYPSSPPERRNDNEEIEVREPFNGQQQSFDKDKYWKDPEPQEIAVMIAYTQAVENAVIDIQLEAYLAIKLTEESFADSDVLIDLDLVRVHKVDYMESSFLKKDNERLMGKSGEDIFMNDVHDERDAAKADIVVLFVNSGSNSLGESGATGADEDTAFATVRYTTNDAPSYTFAHELGHLHGVAHNLSCETSDSPFSFGHGFSSSFGWRTLMACRTSSQERELFWSNPKRIFKGNPAGVPCKSNAVRVLNLTAPYISSFR